MSVDVVARDLQYATDDVRAISDRGRIYFRSLSVKHTGKVYFIVAPELKRVKIGFTDKGIHARVSALQIGSPTPLHHLGFFRGSYSDEARLHSRLREHRAIREWFYLHDDVWRAIYDRCEYLDRDTLKMLGAT